MTSGDARGGGLVELARITVPGAPANKKNRARPTWPWLYGRRLRFEGRPVTGLRDLFLTVDGYLRLGNVQAARRLLQEAAAGLRPVLQPNTEFSKWERAARRVINARRDLRRPLAPKGRLVLVNALFYLAPRQQPDLPGLLEATCDVLEKSGLLANDYFVNAFGRSRRLWPPAGSSKAAKEARLAWAPRSEIYVFDTGVDR